MLAGDQRPNCTTTTFVNAAVRNIIIPALRDRLIRINLVEDRHSNFGDAHFEQTSCVIVLLMPAS